MKIKFKKLVEGATAPTQAKEGDACWDLFAVSKKTGDGPEEDYIEYGTGIAIEIPEDHVGLVFPRSSVTKKDLIMKNCTGIIDSGYRGEIKLRFFTTIPLEVCEVYKIGDRVGQIMIIQRPYLEFEEVKELSSSERGEGGYGSTGS